MPTVSIIIPTYNHWNHVLQTLESVFAQTFSDYEVVVVNDGSPDGTHDLLEPLVRTGLIRYICQENQGQAAARNRGLAEAKGEFIAFLDDDDLWPADKLAWQMEVFRERPDVGVVAGIHKGFGALSAGQWMPEDGQREVAFKEMFDGCPCVSPGATLIRASCLKQVGGFDQSFWGTDDYDLWMRLSTVAKFWKCNRVSLLYRMHKGNASRNTLRMFRNVRRVIQKGLQHCQHEDRAELAKRGCNALYNYHAMPLMWEWRRQLLRGHVIQAWKTWGGILTMACLFARHDPAGLKRMANNLIPRTLQKYHLNFRDRRFGGWVCRE